MEILAVPQRPASGDRRRLLVGMLVLAPIVLFALLPAVLGFERYVITDDSMAGTMGRGSVAIARPVPPGELRQGDVITFHAPGAGEDALVTRRIQSIDGAKARTVGDATPKKKDPWVLVLTEETYPRVIGDVPWVGYPFIGGGWVLLALIAIGALVFAFGLPWRPSKGGPAGPRTRSYRRPPAEAA